MRPIWTGVYPAVTTKFKANGELDIPAFLKNIDFQIESGVSGIIIGGSLGESSTLSVDEKLKLVEVLQPYRNKVPVLMNIAESSTKRAVEAVKLAEANGADGFMLLPPLLYKADADETVAYFKEVANATTLPIILYNNPVDYKIEITIPMFEALLDVSNIEAVKESTRDLTNITRLRNAFGDRFKILGGVDTICLEALLLGADGLVAGLVSAFPKETVVLFDLAKAGKVDEAVKLYRWFMPLLEMDIDPKLVQYIKLAEVYAGIGTEHVRSPRKILSGTERQKAIETIEIALKNRPDLSTC
ncbi:dihydrodipicolinate synthase family protein [Labilibaculum manganireducens]|uniref:Dihydrodipicolinate synthase family protein n=1 Tax=Labilibaculum manganireducens TaxID=1940525 RepID=A0A2N3HRG7_9BACT|nr:dihydrodipicolinate synthase family protein [Labilibaculum manganireducens]PKQ60644.1 dihydrodipicolinate synthase family protein [Labilibaculum manganireducens]